MYLDVDFQFTFLSHYFCFDFPLLHIPLQFFKGAKTFAKFQESPLESAFLLTETQRQIEDDDDSEWVK